MIIVADASALSAGFDADQPEQTNMTNARSNRLRPVCRRFEFSLRIFEQTPTPRVWD
jgi:hypothetical protein